MLPNLITAIPGPRSLDLAEKLRRHESRNVTFLADDWPIFWQRRRVRMSGTPMATAFLI
jgi:4-aminobutyrate aminotransferase/(S)-3-amino-2-methylpropionate transaminase